MEPTITQNGALFAVQHRPVKRNYSQHLGGKTAANQIGTLSRWNKAEQTP